MSLVVPRESETQQYLKVPILFQRLLHEQCLAMETKLLRDFYPRRPALFKGFVVR